MTTKRCNTTTKKTCPQRDSKMTAKILETRYNMTVKRCKNNYRHTTTTKFKTITWRLKMAAKKLKMTRK